VFNETGSAFRFIGQTSEGIKLIEAALPIWKKLNDSYFGARSANNLALTHITAGNIRDAIKAATEAVSLADQSGNLFEQHASRSYLAHARRLHGDLKCALCLFEEAEKLRAQFDPERPKLCGLQGARYCELLIDMGEAETAVDLLQNTVLPNTEVRWVRDVGLAYLALGSAFYELRKPNEAEENFNKAIEHLRQSGQQNELAIGLIQRGKFRRDTGITESARSDLQDALEIIERSQLLLAKCLAMILKANLEIDDENYNSALETINDAAKVIEMQEMFLLRADCRLTLARLHLSSGDRLNAETCLTAEKESIEKMGYTRRKKDIEKLENRLKG
jgi:tetratricopeptide (TPR) repeat protein